MIRKACIEDKQAIIGVIQDAVVDMESNGIYQWDSIYPNEEVIENDLNSGELYVYVDKENIIGIIVLNEYQDREYERMNWMFNSGKHLIVHRLCINPRFQGQGIARLLMTYAEEHGKKFKYQSIRLDSFINNRRACDLYEKLGYKAVGTVHFRKGDFYCFEKELCGK